MAQAGVFDRKLRLFDGSVRPIGIFDPELVGTIQTKAVAGTISFTGAVIKRPRKEISSATSFIGSPKKMSTKSVIGGLSFAGVPTKRPGKKFAGTITPAGAVDRTPKKVGGGAITPTGSIARSPRKILASSLSFVGGIQKRVSKILAGIIGFVGSLFSTGRHIVLRGPSTRMALLVKASRIITIVLESLASCAPKLGASGLVTVQVFQPSTTVALDISANARIRLKVRARMV